MKVIVPFLFILIIALLDCVTGKIDSQEGPPENGPIVLTSRNFDSSISDGNVWLIEFYASWCGHCKRFEPTYEVSSFSALELNACSESVKLMFLQERCK